MWAEYGFEVMTKCTFNDPCDLELKSVRYARVACRRRIKHCSPAIVLAPTKKCNKRDPYISNHYASLTIPA